MGQDLKSIFTHQKPIIGMVHLRPLPGSPMYDKKNMCMERIIDTAVKEAQLLEEGGVDGLQIENIWDYPYVKGEDIVSVSNLKRVHYKLFFSFLNNLY